MALQSSKTLAFVDKALSDLSVSGELWADPSTLASRLRDPVSLNEAPWFEPMEVRSRSGAFGIAFSPKNQSFAFVSFDGMLHIVDTDGKEIATSLQVSTSAPSWGQLSFNAKGDKLAVSTFVGPLKSFGPTCIIDTLTCELVAKYDLQAYSALFHPVLPYLIVGHFASGPLRLIDCDALSPEQELSDSNGAPLKEMSPMKFNAAGSCLALQRTMKKLVILNLDWRGTDNSRCSARYVAELPHGGFIWDCAFHPAQSILLTACGDRKVRLIDSNLAVVIQTLDFHCEVYSLELDSSGRDLAVGLEDHSVRILNFTTKKEIRRLGYGSTVRRVRFSNTGRLGATSGEWNQSPVTSVRVFEPHGVSERVLLMTGEITTVAVNTTGNLVAILHDQTVRVYSSTSCKLIASASVQSAGSPRDQDIAFAPNGMHVAITCMAGLMLLPLSANGDVKALRPDIGPTYSVAYSPNSALLAAVNDLGTLFLIDETENLRTVTGLPAYNKSTPKDKPLACTNTTVAYCCHTEKKATVYLVDIKSAAIVSVLDADASLAASVAFSSAGLLACACALGTGGSKIVVFDGATKMHELIVPDMVWAIAFQPDGTLVAGFGSGVRSLDLSGREVEEVRREVSTAVSHVACSEGVVAYTTKTGELFILSDQADPVYTLRPLLDGQVTMADVLKAHPDWAVRCLPTAFGCLTLLHCAISLNRPEWISELIAHGAHPLTEAHGGITSIDVALHFSQRNSLTTFVAALEELLVQDCSTLPSTFAHTLSKLIVAGLPCTSLLVTRLPPSPGNLPDRADMPTKRRTTCGDSVVLSNSAFLASVEGNALVPVKFEVCRIPGLLTKEAGLLQALYDSPRDDILENHTIEAILQHKWATHGFKLNLITSSLVFFALVAFIVESFKRNLVCELTLLLLALVRAAMHLQQMFFMRWFFWHNVFHVLGVCVVVTADYRTVSFMCSFYTGGCHVHCSSFDMAGHDHSSPHIREHCCHSHTDKGDLP